MYCDPVQQRALCQEVIVKFSVVEMSTENKCIIYRNLPRRQKTISQSPKERQQTMSLLSVTGKKLTFSYLSLPNGSGCAEHCVLRREVRASVSMASLPDPISRWFFYLSQNFDLSTLQCKNLPDDWFISDTISVSQWKCDSD